MTAPRRPWPRMLPAGRVQVLWSFPRPLTCCAPPGWKTADGNPGMSYRLFLVPAQQGREWIRTSAVARPRTAAARATDLVDQRRRPRGARCRRPGGPGNGPAFQAPCVAAARPLPAGRDDLRDCPAAPSQTVLRPVAENAGASTASAASGPDARMRSWPASTRPLLPDTRASANITSGPQPAEAAVDLGPPRHIPP
jgi:hypothetical protein